MQERCEVPAVDAWTNT